MLTCCNSSIKSEQFSLFVCDQSIEVEGDECISEFDSSPLGPFSTGESSGMCYPAICCFPLTALFPV